MWDYVKIPNLRLISVPECDKANESKLENTLQDIIQENYPHLGRQANSNAGNTENTTKIFQKKSNPKAHNRHIQQG